jgi:diketogulonate reductase-like aldo/keto reductase
MMPALAFGTFKITNPQSIVNAVVNYGYLHIDTSPINDNEEIIGEAIHKVIIYPTKTHHHH